MPLRIAVLLIAAALSASGQNIKLGTGIKIGAGITVAKAPAVVAVTVFSASASSNANSSQGTAPARKQLGNFATGCAGGVLQPTGVPVGQLYSTTAVRTAAIAAGCTTQNAVTTTATGTGIANPDNGFNAGGSDSAVTMTDTYGATTNDAVCTSDPNSLPTVVLGLTTPGCVSSSSATFGQSTAASFGNSGVLFPSGYTSTGVDAADHWYRRFYYRLNSLANLWNIEADTNYNDSAGDYLGWGWHWNRAIAMWQYCPQNCSAWVTLKWVNVATSAVVTSYPIVQGHWYAMEQFMSRDAGCTYSSVALCYHYDYVRVWDVTAGGAPVLYQLFDNNSGLVAGGIPINHTTWTRNFPVPQFQLDMITANVSSTYDIVSDEVIAYHF